MLSFADQYLIFCFDVILQKTANKVAFEPPQLKMIILRDGLLRQPKYLPETLKRLELLQTLVDDICP